MFFSSIEEIDEFFDTTSMFSFYGMGKISTTMLTYLETHGLVGKLQSFILSSSEIDNYVFYGKPIRFVGNLTNEEKRVPIFIATQEVLHNEIITTLANNGITTFFAASDEMLSLLKLRADQKIFGNCDEDKVIQELSKLRSEPGKVDILMLSPPYWDIYSPFSAVPSLMGKLRENGITAKQSDIGIECFRYLLACIWKYTSLYFINYSFYQKEVCRYKNNPYKTYEDYCDALWFFQEKEFPVDKVKANYDQLDDVQRGVIDDFYQRILSQDSHYVNFNIMCSIHDSIENSFWGVLYSALLSDKIKFLLNEIPDIVGIAVTGINQFLPACKLASLIRAVKPDVKLIMGGSCADLYMESKYASKSEIYDYFDFIIVGEGETAIYKLYKYLKGDGLKDDIPNIAWVDNDNKVIYSAQILEDVEALPLADYTDLDLNRYMAPRPILPYQASRGCHYGHCAFCNHNEKYRHNYRMKSENKVVEEIVELSKIYDIKNIQFVDEAIHPNHFDAIVAEMERKEEFRYICWFFYSRVSRQYTKSLLNRAYKCGCRMVMFGVETLNQRLLNFIKKGIMAETSKYCLKLFHENGISTYAWLMGNLPSETVEELREDIADVENNISYIDAAHVGAFCLEINTDMYHALEQYNILSVDLSQSERFSSHNNGAVIDKDEMLACIKKEYVPMLKKHFFHLDRYHLYFGKMKK